MSTLHPLSHGTPLSEFDIFSIPPTQLSAVSDVETEHRPSQPMSVDRLVQFEFSTAPNEYIKWSDTEMYMKIRIKLIMRDGKTPLRTAWDDLLLEGNFMHSLIQSVDLTINGRLITKSSITYAYRAFFDNYIGYSREAKEGHLSSIGWAEPKHEDSRYLPKKGGEQAYGEYFELRGKLCLDIAQQGRALIGGLSYKLEIRFNKAEMALTTASTDMTCDWEMGSLALLVHRTIVSQGTLVAHAKALQHATAKYPITRHEVKAFSLGTGMMDVMLERVFNGRLPRRILVGFVLAEAFRGTLKHSFIDFDNFKINHLAFTVDGQSFPRSPYMPDFAKKQYMREYYSFLQAFNQDSVNPSLDMSYDDYYSGKTFFAYNFAPDLGDGCGFGGYLNLIKTGCLGIQIRFAAPPTVPITAIVFAEFDSLIQIDKNLQVTTDYIV